MNIARPASRYDPWINLRVAKSGVSVTFIGILSRQPSRNYGDNFPMALARPPRIMVGGEGVVDQK